MENIDEKLLEHLRQDQLVERGSTPDGAVTALLRPRSVAVVGASENTYAGSNPILNLKAQGFGGRIFPVNPRYTEVFGIPTFPAVDALPEPPDTVLLAVGLQRVVQLADTALLFGAKSLVVPAGGYTESGLQAIDIADQLRVRARQVGAAVCGPNAMGAINFTHGSSAYIGQFPYGLKPGSLGAVFQSGSICEGFLNGVGRLTFSTIVASGAEQVTDVADYLHFLALDDATEVVCAYIEGVRRPRAFLAALDELYHREKRVIVLKAGRSARGRESVAAHSAVLAPDDRVFAATLGRHGVTLVDDLDELVETAVLFTRARRTVRRRPYVVSNSGGEASVLLDVAHGVGLALDPPPPELVQRVRDALPGFAFVGNPADPGGVGRVGDMKPYAAVLEAAAACSFDILVAAFDAPAGSSPPQVDLARGIVETLAHAGSRSLLRVAMSFYGTPFCSEIRDGAHANSVVMLHGLRQGLLALRHLQEAPRFGGLSSILPSEPMHGEAVTMAADDAVELIAAYDIPVVPYRFARSRAEAVTAAHELGPPLVVKIVSGDLPHKSEAGGVELPVQSVSAAGAAYDRVLQRVAVARPTARLEGVQIQKLLSGVECIAGIARDPQFGPVVVFGLGGLYAEVFADTAIEPVPIDHQGALALIARTKVGRVLQGVRSQPPSDLAALARVLVGLSRLALDRPEVVALDLNPIIVGRHGEGVAATDVLIVTVSPSVG